jgi:cell division septal protein FtsQ
MFLFGFNKKKKFGQSSNISKLRSPYLKKLPTPSRVVKRAKKSSLIIPPARIKISTHRWKKVLTIILSLGIITFLIYGLFYSDYFTIDNYRVEEAGTIIDNNSAINEILQKQLGKNLVLMNEEELAKQIKTVRPEIEKIKIKKIFPDTIGVEYEKYPTVANIVNIVNSVQKKYLVDSQGLLTEEDNENPDLPYIRIETKEIYPIRTTILNDPTKSAERLTYIIQAINLFEEKFGMKIIYAQFKIREREIHLFTEKSFFVILDMEKDLNKQIDKLKKAQSKLDIYNTPLVYIDLRISGTDNEKVIFKKR